MIIAESFIGSNEMWSALISALIAVMMGLAALWGALYVAKPKRRLLWVEALNAPLLSDTSASSSVHVSTGTAVLTNPRVVQLGLKNGGRRDIVQSDFASDNDSLCFDFHAPIVQVMSTQVEPGTAPTPTTRVDGTKLYVHKGLIKSSQVIRFSILVDGDNEDVTCENAHIVETKTKQSNNSNMESWWQQYGNMATGAIIGGAIFFTLTLTGYQEPIDQWISEKLGQRAYECKVGPLEIETLNSEECLKIQEEAKSG
ncbi:MULTISPECIES: hypothetical protein [unclassified Streptomyces]|uniref:hypothetical protein n=1 Tax=unclassified Streptomyces TaxID=2593676 RepID=UPI002365CC89|nr:MULTISPECIES: hypothetical protein [unclassified Streptomyces]MDF3141789.1 hypothetical protein [Streptomyces sp. T21Q-yed]WDF36436.1 hypothetical protein PBV52_06440 [Streptomyces sp. T12]